MKIPTEIWHAIHQAADRVSLEATRMRNPMDDDAADIYIQTYGKVMDFLIRRDEVDCDLVLEIIDDDVAED